MSIQVSTKKTLPSLSVRPLRIQPSSSQQVPLFPLPLYRTHKHKCGRCSERCHIIYEIGSTDCVCEQYIGKKNEIISKPYV